MGRSVLIVPVAELEPVVRARIVRGVPEYLSRGAGDVHAHITLLGPVAEQTTLQDTLTSWRS